MGKYFHYSTLYSLKMTLAFQHQLCQLDNLLTEMEHVFLNRSVLTKVVLPREDVPLDLECVVYFCIHQHPTQYHIMIATYKIQGFLQLIPALEPQLHTPFKSVQMIFVGYGWTLNKIPLKLLQ